MGTDMTQGKKTHSNGVDFYEELLSDYDQMIDWQSRLQRETPFFSELFSRYNVKSLLDVGCGTGRHGFHFLTLGVESVVGADPSARVIELAQSRASASGAEIRFIEASFTDINERVSSRFDMVCTLGNSISHLLTYDDLERTLKNFKNLLSPDGVALVHCLNWDLRLAERKRFIPPNGIKTSHGEKLFFRFFDFEDEVISTTLRPWRRDVLLMALQDTGLIVSAEFGGTDLSPHNPEKSHDYIFVAARV
jgi:SAM-dependent methyltransferase